MPTALLLRFCICSLLVLTLNFDTAAQRTSRRRSFSAADSSVAETSPAQLNIFKLPCEKRSNTLVLKVPSQTKDDIQEDTAIRHELKATLGELLRCSTTLNAQNELSNLPDCRETNSINKPYIADAYPYLTGDGLRLYFTSNREGAHGRFFISTRETVTDPFSEPKFLSKNLTDGYYAGTLTADELTLCMVNSGDMYISIRNSQHEEFPVPVKLKGTNRSHYFGPSISQDGKEIFVTVEIAGKDVTMVYKRTGTYSVEEKRKLNTPKGYEPGPGQLSKDGLSYLLSLKNESSKHLWKYMRASTADDFTDPVELPEPMAGLKNSIQPSLNGDGSILVFVTSPNSVWSEDDILLVNTFKNNFVYPKIADSIVNNAGNTVKLFDKINSPQLVVYEYPEILDVEVNQFKQSTVKVKGLDNNMGSSRLKVYPNPFINSVIIEISEMPEHGALFNLYDLSGKLIKQQKISSVPARVSLSQLLVSVYTYRVIDEKGILVGSGKLVKSR